MSDKEVGKMGEVRLQYLLPHQIARHREKLSLVFLPLGLLEWHGPHLPLGVDAINAESVAVAVAKRVGGVVLPTLFVGTEKSRSKQDLASYNLEDAVYVEGMDFPDMEERSYYWREEIFGIVVRSQVLQAIEKEYRLIFIINGHGAPNQAMVLDRLMDELNHRYYQTKIAWAYPFPERILKVGSISHASYEETSLMLHYHPELVDLAKLPSEGALHYKDYAIVDAKAFLGKPGAGYALREEYDPRWRSSAETGKGIFRETVAEIAEKVSKLISEMKRSKQTIMPD